jgi:type II secretory pathway component PulC
MATPSRPSEIHADAAGRRRLDAAFEWRRAAWLRRVVFGALSVAIAAQAAHTSLSLWTLARTPAAGLPRGSTPSAAATPHQADVAELVAAHLFGKSPDNPPPEASAAAAASWVLTGTLLRDSPANGAAILGATAATTRLYAAGEEVAGGFRLTEVFSDHVMLERADERLTVKLPRAIHGSLALTSTTLAAAAAVPETRSREERLRERPQNQTPALLELRPSLHRGLGRFDGMRVWGAGDGSNLAAYGLRRNDVIREVNGEAIDDVTAEYRALEAMSRGHPVAITVERSGNVFTLQLGFTDTGG